MITTSLPEATSPAQRAERADSWLQWRPELVEEPQRLSVAELAECLCPDLCNRDHANE